MIYVKVCQLCGKKFETRFPYQKFCSKECGNKHNAFVVRCEIASPAHTNKCVICHKPLNKENTGYLHTRKLELDYTDTCSPECAEKLEKLIHRRHHCRNCGKYFIPFSRSQRYCSEKCRIEYTNKLKQKPPVEELEKVCPHCGKVFTTTNPHKKFCSKECCVAYHTNNDYNILRTKYCESCGKEFQGTYYTKYCSKECREKEVQRKIRNGNSSYDVRQNPCIGNDL